VSFSDEVVFMVATAQLNKPKPGPQHPDQLPTGRPQPPIRTIPKPKGEAELIRENFGEGFYQRHMQSEKIRISGREPETKIQRAFRLKTEAKQVAWDREQLRIATEEAVKAGRAALRARELTLVKSASIPPDPAALFDETLKQYKALQAAGKSREANEWYDQHRNILCSPSKQART
jgi:hypothetical protein